MAVQQIIRMTNVGDTDFKSEFELDMYVIRPGASVLMPRAALNCWFGDPYLTNAGKDEWRKKEYNRVRRRYGCYADQTWDDIRPKIECYDATTNERILTVGEDPNGDGNRDHSIYDGSPATLIDRVEQLTRELDALRATMVTENHGLGSTPETLTVDTPGPVSPAPAVSPSGGGRPRKKATPKGQTDEPAIAPPNVTVPKDKPSRVGIS